MLSPGIILKSMLNKPKIFLNSEANLVFAIWMPSFEIDDSYLSLKWIKS